MSEKSPPDDKFDSALAKLREAYVGRLANSIQAIDAALTQFRLKALTTEGFKNLRSMSHTLAGSGATFGFAAVTDAARATEYCLDRVIAKLDTNEEPDPADLEEFQGLAFTLSEVCAEILKTEKKADEDIELDFAPAAAPVKRMAGTFDVLVIDDDKHISNLLYLRLQQIAVRMTVAQNGTDALQAIRNRRFDLIILDVNLPDMSGNDILKKIKADERYNETPVLMLTGNAEQNNVINALNLGAIDYIIKPFSVDQLMTRVETILNSALHTVLIADNDPLLLQLVSGKFRHAGYKVVLVNDGRDAWDRIHKILPDLVILDRMMPGLEGLSVLKNMRTEDATRDIPVIVLSARNEQRDIDIGLKMGAQIYMGKPFQPDELLANASKLLGTDS